MERTPKPICSQKGAVASHCLFEYVRGGSHMEGSKAPYGLQEAGQLPGFFVPVGDQRSLRSSTGGSTLRASYRLKK